MAMSPASSTRPSPSTTGIDIYLGSGGAPEGVLAAAALRCIGGQMHGRLILDSDEKRQRAEAHGIRDLRRVYRAEDMASGDVLFAATGITDGSLFGGVRFGRGQRPRFRSSPARRPARSAGCAQSIGTGTSSGADDWMPLTLFGLFAVTAMLAFYAVEHRSPWFILAFAGACLLASLYGFLSGAWPFGVVEAIWALVALRRWQKAR